MPESESDLRNHTYIIYGKLESFSVVQHTKDTGHEYQHTKSCVNEKYKCTRRIKHILNHIREKSLDNLLNSRACISQQSTLVNVLEWNFFFVSYLSFVFD